MDTLELDPQDWEPLYAVVYKDHGKRYWRTRRPLARVVGCHGPLTLAQAHTVLDLASLEQDDNPALRRYTAEIVPVGSPLGNANPFDLGEFVQGLLDITNGGDAA